MDGPIIGSHAETSLLQQRSLSRRRQFWILIQYGEFGKHAELVGGGFKRLATAADSDFRRDEGDGPFQPCQWDGHPNQLCGGYSPGATSNSGTNPDVIYTANIDQQAHYRIFLDDRDAYRRGDLDAGHHGRDGHALRGEFQLPSGKPS